MIDNCPTCGAWLELCTCDVCGEEHEITVTSESCCYDPDLRDLLHRELAAHGIVLDTPHVDFCTTVGMILTRQLEDRRIVYRRLGEMQQHSNEQLQTIRELRTKLGFFLP